MAEEKKKGSNTNTFEEIVFLLAGLFLLSVIINQIVAYFDSLELYDWGHIWNALFASYFYSLWFWLKVAAVVLGLGCLIWMLYSRRRLGEIDEEEKQVYGSKPEESLAQELAESSLIKEKKNEKWERVQAHINSDSPAEWRLGIIEADIMLDELLKEMNYHGDTVGDKLKAAEGGEFLNLEAAWEAHKIRNRIAHSGGDYQLSEREARRAIRLYETVFKEFQLI